MPGNKKYSVVWNNYIKTTGGGICKLCGKEIKSCGNTTNLMNHLQRKHDFVSNQANRKKKSHPDTRSDTTSTRQGNSSTAISHPCQNGNKGRCFHVNSYLCKMQTVMGIGIFFENSLSKIVSLITKCRIHLY
jgi:hypothetical protein